MTQRIAILGAGPIGLEAALYGRTLGYDVQVYEQGRVGEHISRWGHISLFSPFLQNRSSLGRQALEGRVELPEDDAILSGEQYRSVYLMELARHPLLQGRVRERTKVVSVGRTGVLKGELIGSERRSSYPFRLLLEDAERVEHVETADFVLDCTGVYSSPNWAGLGGMPAPGERQLRQEGMLPSWIPDPLGLDRGMYAGRTTLLLGGRASAATTALALIKLAEVAPGTRLIWALRDEQNPYRPIENDPYPRRAELYREAHRLLEEGHPALNVLFGFTVDRFTPGEKIGVSLLGPNGTLDVVVDEIVANVGYQPDTSIYSELQVSEDYAARGPMIFFLAPQPGDMRGNTGLARDWSASTLRNPEPSFFILGAKRYGKSAQFMIWLGLEHVRDVYRLITAQPELDLYSKAENELDAEVRS